VAGGLNRHLPNVAGSDNAHYRPHHSPNDGYQVVLSGGEIDPNFGNAPMLLSWDQDGQPLAGDDGPLRLVVPGVLRGGRFVHGIVSIEVRSIEEAVS
jgi:hypothetical protein